MLRSGEESLLVLVFGSLFAEKLRSREELAGLAVLVVEFEADLSCT